MNHAKPYGHEAIVECRGSGGVGYRQVSIRRKGSRRTVERAAELLTCFTRIVSIQEFSEDQWVRVFGRGRM